MFCAQCRVVEVIRTPPGTHPFASHIRRNFENNVADIKNGQDRVVIVSLEMEILFQTGQTCISNICSVDEAE